MLAVPPGVGLNNPQVRLGFGRGLKVLMYVWIQESLRILQTYAGAVVQAHGAHALFDWIALLV